MGMGTLFISALIMGFSGAMMPGPLLTATINESFHRGFSAGPRMIIGHSILELILVIGLIMGLGEFLLMPLVKTTIAIMGGFFLLWMAWGILRDVGLNKVRLELAATGTTQKLQPELLGILASVSNPYWTIWWATIGLSYLVLSFEQGILGLSAFFLGHISSDFIWYSLVSLAVTSGKRFISHNVYRIILSICGIFLLCLAVYFIYSGIKFLGIINIRGQG